MSVILVVTGADSATHTSDWVSIPTLKYDTIEQARSEMYRYVAEWEAAGFTQTLARIYRKGSVWRRVVVIDEYGVSWYPLTAEGRELMQMVRDR